MDADIRSPINISGASQTDRKRERGREKKNDKSGRKRVI
jgi:hypothetical protein